MPKIRVNDQELFYAQTQRTGDTALLLVHGAGGSHLDWPRALLRLATDPPTAVYSIDLPGHGRSQPPGRSSIDAYADILQAFIETLGLRRIVVAGHSMGGAIAQVLALRRPAQLAGLVLMATAARLRVNPDLLEQIVPEPETAVAFIIKYGMGPNLPQDVRQLARRRLLEIEPHVLRDDFAACDAFDVRNDISTLQVPALVITGSADKMVPLKFSQSLAEQIPAAELVTVEGSGHYVMLEQPQEVAGAVADFMERRVLNRDA